MVLEIIVGGLFFAHSPGYRGAMCRLSLSLLGGRKRVRKGPIFKGEMVPDKSGRNYLQWKSLYVLGINARVYGKWPAMNVLWVFVMQWGSKVCISIICDRYRTCNVVRNWPGQKWSHNIKKWEQTFTHYIRPPHKRPEGWYCCNKRFIGAIG